MAKQSDLQKDSGSDIFHEVKKNRIYRSIAVKLIFIILTVSIIPYLIVSLNSLYSVQTVSTISSTTNQEIAQTSAEDTTRALETELIRILNIQTTALGNDINQKLHQVTVETTTMRDYASFLYKFPENFKNYPNASTYSRVNGSNYGSTIPDNNSWLLVSDLAENPDGTIPDDVLKEVRFTEWMDIMFRSIAANDPNAVQLYINTKSQITRGMPFVNGTYKWIDATEQFPHDINLPEYDFYYLANETNNPTRKTVWTTLYYDPAGLGWMISSISPVYLNNELKAVVGTDITLHRITDSILNVTIEKSGFAFLMSKNGRLIAFPERAGPFLGYNGTLNGTFQRDEQLQYNLLNATDTHLRNIALNMSKGHEDVIRYTSPHDNREYFFSYTFINETGWSIGVVVPVNEVTAPALLMNGQIQNKINISSQQISDNVNQLKVNTTLLIILILVAMIPTALILSNMLSQPLRTIIEGSRQIGSGDLDHRITISTHDELEDLAINFNNMAVELGKKLNELEKANQDLRQMDTIKSQFISIASHELRTPLIAIKGYIDLLLTDKNNQINADQKRKLEIIARNTTRLGRIINELLDISTIEENRLALLQDWFSIPDLIHDVTEELSSSFEKRGHRLSLDIADNIPLFFGDKDRIAQVFINLLGNSIKYTPDHGIISVHARSEGEHIICEVEDNGIGISEENISRIFTRFYQVNSITTHKTGKDEFLAGGTGLGLSIVKGIIDAHQGSISVKSSEGKGTTFQIILPVKQGAQQVDIPGKDDSAAKEKHPSEIIQPEVTERIDEKKTILVIDDEPDTVQLFEDILSIKYNVLTAHSGATGIKIALSSLPNLILLDAWMPGITGYDVSKTLKKNSKTQTTPIIIITAAVGSDDQDKARACGADYYLKKPFENSELLVLLDRFLEFTEKNHDKP